MTKISITRALVEIKTLDDRIKSAINGSMFVSLTKGRGDHAKPIIAAYKDVNEVKDTIKAHDQTVTDLIKRRSALKSAVSKANVETRLTVGGKEMSIVDAIDMKHVNGYKKLIVAVMMAQLKSASNNIEQARAKTEADVQASIERLLGTDVKNKEAVAQNAALIESTKKAILDMHELALIDPLGVKDRITALSKEIAEVDNEIDFALSEVNAKTEIEIA